ncbi:MAG: hypothetical protein COA60_006335 [Robiginitomaculum sp.]|nr:hypothetical protein [Robiginitomaculum sp.]
MRAWFLEACSLLGCALIFLGFLWVFSIPIIWLILEPTASAILTNGLISLIFFVAGWVSYLLAMALEKGLFGWTWQTAEPVLGYALFWGLFMAPGILIFSPVFALLFGWQTDQWATGVDIAIRLIPFSLGYAIIWYGIKKWIEIIGANRKLNNENLKD